MVTFELGKVLASLFRSTPAETKFVGAWDETTDQTFSFWEVNGLLMPKQAAGTLLGFSRKPLLINFPNGLPIVGHCS